jgi:hypothetical protein
MTTIGLQNLAGMLPIKDAALLPDGAAAYCENAYLYGGSIEGFPTANPAYTLKNSNTQAVYRIPVTQSAQPDFVNSLWLEFADPFISILRAPMIEDQYKRYYFFPSGGSPYYNTLDNLLAGAPGYTLGVPAPETAPTVSYAGGTAATQEVRAYLYTWETGFSEEGPPSAPTVLQGTVDGTWTIGLTPPLPIDYEGRNLTTVNIYRTVTDSNGNAAYYRVAQLPIGTTAYTDAAADTAITGNLQLLSAATDPVTGTTNVWTGPPADLQGVVLMANGIMAGWSNEKEVWFSAAYLPHAWPSSFALTVDAPIVGLAAVGSSVIILTQGSPWIASGVTPDTITLGKIAAREPCIARGSIAPAGEGAYYASPNGLILVNPTGTTNVTQYFMSKDDWIATGVYNFAASKYAMAYVAFAKGSAAVDNGIILDHEVQNVAFSWLSVPGPVVNVYNDELSGGTFIIANGRVVEWNPETVTSLMPYIWTSKQFRFPFAQQIVGGMIYFTVPGSVNIPQPTPATRNTSQSQVFNPATQYLVLSVFADGNLVLVREIQESGELVLFPSGFKATYWQFSVQGQVTIKEMKFATSIKELQAA